MANGNNNFEASLFNTADKLRKNIDAAEYKNVVLGLIFLKYISASISAPYEDIKGYCKSAKLSEIEKHSFVLTPGRYVGIPDEEDDGIPFDEKMKDLTTTLAGQIAKEKVLDKQLAKIGFVL